MKVAQDVSPGYTLDQTQNSPAGTAERCVAINSAVPCGTGLICYSYPALRTGLLSRRPFGTAACSRRGIQPHCRWSSVNASGVIQIDRSKKLIWTSLFLQMLWETGAEPQIPPLRYPGFPVGLGGSANLMRLSLKKAAHGPSLVPQSRSAVERLRFPFSSPPGTHWGTGASI